MNDQQADVLIIGAGVVGLSVAYYAASAGAKVLVLEKGEIGSGSSWGNAGLIVPSYFEPLPAISSLFPVLELSGTASSTSLTRKATLE